MTTMVSVSDLTAKSASDVLREYAAKLPDGKAVMLGDLIAELGLPKATIDRTARQLRLTITAFSQLGDVSKRLTFIANPKTVAAWQKSQQSK